jgi:hypothetical protein
MLSACTCMLALFLLRIHVYTQTDRHVHTHAHTLIVACSGRWQEADCMYVLIHTEMSCSNVHASMRRQAAELRRRNEELLDLQRNHEAFRYYTYICAFIRIHKHGHILVLFHIINNVYMLHLIHAHINTGI